MASLIPTPITPPGIDVIQAVRTESVPIVIPVTKPIVVGPCFKVLEATNTDGSLNEDARLAVPAMYMPQVFTGVQVTDPAAASPPVAAPSETLTLSVNGFPGLVVTFASAGGVTTYTLAAIVTAINTAIAAAGASLTAEIVMVSATNGILRIRTTGGGDSWGLTAVWGGSGTVLPTFLTLPTSWSATGKSKYDGGRLLLTKSILPDPWSLGDDLDIQKASIRAFLTTPTTVKKEQSRTEVVSRCGNSFLLMDDDGDGDGTTPLLRFVRDQVASPAIPADMEHTAALPRKAALINFDDTPTAATITSTAVSTWDASIHTFRLSIDGWEKQTIVTDATPTVPEVVALINARFPGRAASDGLPDPAVVITGLLFGREGEIWLEDNAATQDLFGFAAPGATTFGPVERGTWQKVKIGDEVWIGGVKFGTIIQLMTVGAGVDQIVRLDTEYALDYFTLVTGEAMDWYIVSKNLPSQMESLTADPADPSPELFVSDYFVQMRHDTLRGSKGDPMYIPITTTDVKAYESLFYKALRLDVTVAASTRDAVPMEVNGRDFTTLDTIMDPVDAQNPLGLGMYFALLNSGDTPVMGFGVDEVSTTYPDGTPDAYARAFAALRSQRLYAMAPLTQDLESGLSGLAHVLAMSNTRRKGERIMFFSSPLPTRAEAELVGSGTEGNTGAAPAFPFAFQTGMADLADLFIAAGMTDAFPWDATDGVYLDIEGDANHYLVQSYAGATLTCVTGAVGNGFFATTAPAAQVIDKNFSIQIRGALLVDSVGNPDRAAQAIAIGKRAAQFHSKRVSLIAPGECEATVGGLATRLPTHYVAAALAGLRCGQRPEKPINNIPIQGFTKVFYSDGYFEEDDMNQAAGYGVWWVINDSTMGNIITRWQTTTDVSSVKIRESSCVMALDWGTYCIRDSLRALMGTMNVVPSTLDTFSMGLGGVFNFLVEDTKVWLKADLVTFQQGPFAATPEDVAEGLGPGLEDEILAEVEVSIAVPANKFRIRLFV